MKHLLLINELDRSAKYGIGTYINQLLKCIKQINDIHLHLINIKCDIKEIKTEHSESYSEYSFPSFLYYTNNYYRDIWFIIKLNIEQQLNNDDELVVHINMFHQLPLIECIKKDHPQSSIILTVHYLTWSFLFFGNRTKFKNIIENNRSDFGICKQYELDKKLLNMVKYIVCLSQNTKEILLQDYHIHEDKIKLIYNGLEDVGYSVTYEEKLELRKKMYFSENEKIILFVGRLDPIKGLDILINSFKFVLDRKRDSRLVIIGDGDFSKYLDVGKDYSSKIVFTGHLNKSEIYNFYKIADVGVMPSMHEQCSYVAIEMLMFNLPLIVSKTTGLNEVLNDEEYKINVEESEDSVEISAKELSNKILSSFKNTNKCNKSIYNEKYKLDIMLNKMKQLYESC